MNSDNRLRRRGRICLGLVFAVLAVFSATFFKIQIVDGEEYVKAGEQIKVKNVAVEGARGEILDRNGNPLVTNRQGSAIVFDSAFFPSAKEQGERNAIIYSLIMLFEQQGVPWNDDLPLQLSKDGKTVSFLPDRDKDIDFLRTEILNLNPYATAQNCMDALVETYELKPFAPDAARQHRPIPTRRSLGLRPRPRLSVPKPKRRLRTRRSCPHSPHWKRANWASRCRTV